MMVRVHACIRASIVYTRKHGVHEGGPALTWAGADRVNLMALWLPTVGADFEHNMRSVFLEVKLCSSIRDATTARATELSAVPKTWRRREGTSHSSCTTCRIRWRQRLRGGYPREARPGRCASVATECAAVCLTAKQGVCSSTYDDAHGSLSNRLMGFIRTKAPTHL